MKLFKRKPKTVAVLVPRNDLTDAEIKAVVTDMFEWQEKFTTQSARIAFLADRRKG